MVSLSARLEAVLGLLLPCELLADVCTDHGLVPIAAVARGIAARAIAADLREAPLRVARQNVQNAALQERVALLQGDGLLPLQGQAVDAIVMAGVSGGLMLRLCQAAPAVLTDVRQLVVQPNADAPEVRAWAMQHGFHLRDERMVEIRDRFFVVCAFDRANGDDPVYRLPGLGSFAQATLCNVGPHLLARKDAVALRWSSEQCTRLQRLVDEGVSRLAGELAEWQAARAFLQA